MIASTLWFCRGIFGPKIFSNGIKNGCESFMEASWILAQQKDYVGYLRIGENSGCQWNLLFRLKIHWFQVSAREKEEGRKKDEEEKIRRNLMNGWRLVTRWQYLSYEHCFSLP